MVVSTICEFRFCSCCGCGFCFLLLSFVVFCCFLLLFILLFWTLPPLFCSSRPPILFTSPTYLPDCLPNYLPEYLPWLNLLSEFFVVVVVVFFAVLLIFFYMLFRGVAVCFACGCLFFWFVNCFIMCLIIFCLLVFLFALLSACFLICCVV